MLDPLVHQVRYSAPLAHCLPVRLTTGPVKSGLRLVWTAGRRSVPVRTSRCPVFAAARSPPHLHRRGQALEPSWKVLGGLPSQHPSLHTLVSRMAHGSGPGRLGPHYSIAREAPPRPHTPVHFPPSPRPRPLPWLRPRFRTPPPNRRGLVWWGCPPPNQTSPPPVAVLARDPDSKKGRGWAGGGLEQKRFAGVVLHILHAGLRRVELGSKEAQVPRQGPPVA